VKSWCCNRRTPSGGFRLYANQDEGVHAGQGIVPVDTNKVRVDGEETTIHITDQSIMFENEGRVSGFERSAIRMAKPDGDAMIIAYVVGSEVKSVRVEPMSAVASLVASGASQTPTRILSTDVDVVFEMLYRETRKELEERLMRVQAEPENKSLRLTPEEESKYSQVSRQMENLLGSKYGFAIRGEEDPISFWGLEKQPYEVQLAVVKTLHISFLRMIVDPTAERNDIVYSGSEVWPDDWERILVHFKLLDGPILPDKYRRYLEAHWKHRPGDKKPVLARA